MKSSAISHVKADPPLRENVRGLTLTDLEVILSSIGEKSFRAKQLASWVYKRRASSFDEMTNLSQELRDRLEKCLVLKDTPSVKTEHSHDGTIKLLLALEDGEKVECVLIPDGKRLTLCISTQAGCAMGCAFCFTGLTGFRRNLLAHEMVDQIFAAHNVLSRNKKITNYVLMGMGEPLTNYGEVKKFLTLATSKDCLEISPRRIT
jgi:23S rRNA (adenine2503-C2)-methyltransferase